LQDRNDLACFAASVAMRKDYAIRSSLAACIGLLVGMFAFHRGPRSVCSCQVKRLNPGVDLLMNTDWDSILDSDASSEPVLPAPMSGG
jgi:hypothetical protein